MNRNFRVVSHCELEGAFGLLDVHNAYDLTGVEYEPTNRTARMSFEANRWAPPRAPKRFAVLFRDVARFEHSGSVDGLFEIAEVGFKDPGDEDYGWLLEEDLHDVSGSDLLFLGHEGEVIRVTAGSGAVLTGPLV